MRLSILYFIYGLLIAHYCRASFFSSEGGGWRSKLQSLFHRKHDSVENQVDLNTSGKETVQIPVDNNDNMEQIPTETEPETEQDYSEAEKIKFVNDFIENYYQGLPGSRPTLTPSATVSTFFSTISPSTTVKSTIYSSLTSFSASSSIASPDERFEVPETVRNPNKSAYYNEPVDDWFTETVDDIYTFSSTYEEQPTTYDLSSSKSYTTGLVQPVKNPYLYDINGNSQDSYDYEYSELLETEAHDDSIEDCNPQNPDDLIEPSNNDFNNIVINFFNDTELEAINQDKLSQTTGEKEMNNIDAPQRQPVPYPAHYIPSKRDINETRIQQQEHEQQLEKVHHEFSSYDINNSSPRKLPQTKKQKKENLQKTIQSLEETKKKTSKDNKKKENDKKNADNGDKQLKSNIKIINRQSKKPVNTNKNAAKNKKTKKLQKEKEIPDELLPYMIKEDDGVFPSLKKWTEENKNNWKQYTFYDSKDDCIDWDDWDKHDTYEGDCDKLDQIKKYIKGLFEKIDKEKGHAIAEIINILCHINEGKHKGIHFLLQLVAMLGEEALLILKTLLVLIHRLTEAGLEGIQLVLQAIIEVEDVVLEEFQDDCFCKCDCPTKKGRILNHVQLLFFKPSAETTWKSEEVVMHLKELFKIYENQVDCWCDCHCDNRKGNFYEAYSIQDIDLSESPYFASTFYQAYRNTTNSSIDTTVSVAVSHMSKRKRERKHYLAQK